MTAWAALRRDRSQDDWGQVRSLSIISILLDSKAEWRPTADPARQGVVVRTALCPAVKPKLFEFLLPTCAPNLGAGEQKIMSSLLELLSLELEHSPGEALERASQSRKP